mgnify:CR=1 FL=1|tara:strand:- start:2890 stop:3093 length:204 start_codon:yes stop_codon:yes gene_type:complete
MTYEVQTLYYPDTWENTWITDDKPTQFDTYAEAAAELADHLRSMAIAVINDHLDDFNPSDYRIVKND